MKYLLLCIALFCTSNLMLGQTVDPDYLDGELYLKVEDTSNVTLTPLPNIPALTLILSQFGVDTIYRPFTAPDPQIQRIYRLEFSDINNTALFITQLNALSFLEYAEQVPLIQTTGTDYLPNDLNTQQWALTKINAPLAWDIERGDPTIKVAVVDNAVSTTHEDLVDVIWTNPGEIPNNFLDDDLNGYMDDVNGYDVADRDGNPNPPAGTPATSAWVHGTHCSGIVGASSDNNIGIASIGFNLTIIPVKASLDATGGNTLERAYEGVDYAVAAGADVISMSWGSKGNSATGNLIMTMAQNNGVVLVGAAGNDNSTDIFFPAGYSNVIAVGSTDQADMKSGFSNYGAWIDLMAPGSAIYACVSDSTNSAYANLSGTSMACPLVAGLAGLLLSADPSLDATQMKSALQSGCENIDLLNPQYVGQMGSGRINAYNSLVAIGAVGVENELNTNLSLFPNPVEDRLSIASPNSSGTVTVFDLQGHQLISQPYLNEVELDFSNLSIGSYWVRIQQGQHMVSKLVVKQ